MSAMVLRKVEVNGKVIAVEFNVGECSYLWEGTFMFTPADWGVQVGVARHAKGYTVAPHWHPRSRDGEVTIGVEALIVLKGKVKVVLYNDKGERIHERELPAGEGIVMKCAHSVEFLEDSIIIEVKEGPYPGIDSDKKWL